MNDNFQKTDTYRPITIGPVIVQPDPLTWRLQLDETSATSFWIDSPDSLQGVTNYLNNVFTKDNYNMHGLY